jgi:hypothetical protein
MGHCGANTAWLVTYWLNTRSVGDNNDGAACTIDASFALFDSGFGDGTDAIIRKCEWLHHQNRSKETIHDLYKSITCMK